VQFAVNCLRSGGTHRSKNAILQQSLKANANGGLVFYTESGEFRERCMVGGIALVIRV
jgi:hypothetical protein